MIFEAISFPLESFSVRVSSTAAKEALEIASFVLSTFLSFAVANNSNVPLVLSPPTFRPLALIYFAKTFT
jgi:hypothetical protein